MLVFKSRSSNLRKLIRGYRTIITTGELRRYRSLLTALKSTEIPNLKSTASKSYFGFARESAEVSTRQYLYGLLGEKFFASICFSYATQKPVCYPLPRCWQVIIEKWGIPVCRTRCTALFASFVIFKLFKNITKFLVYFYKLMVYPATQEKAVKYVYFFNLKPNNLPRRLDLSYGGSVIESTYDICSWYYKNYHANIQFSLIGHSLRIKRYRFKSVDIKQMRFPWEMLHGFSNKRKLFCWWFAKAVFSFFELLRGRWWYAILLCEASHAFATRLSERKLLAEQYLFHFSGLNYRPLWTYTAQQLGCSITVYFYSHYRSLLFRSSAVENSRFEFSALTWPKFLVWDEAQKMDIASCATNKHSEFDIVGPIWFSDSIDKIPFDVNRESVCVFPVEPHRLALWRGVTPGSEFLATHPSVHRDFLQDIVDAFARLDLQILIKGKRAIGSSLDKSIGRLYEKIAERDNITFVDPSISAFRISDGCIASISFPFTSAALCATPIRTLSAYYDPTQALLKTDPAANGILVLSGKRELESWIQKIAEDNYLKIRRISIS